MDQGRALTESQEADAHLKLIQKITVPDAVPADHFGTREKVFIVETETNWCLIYRCVCESNDQGF